MSVTTTSLRQGKFETRFWHKVFEEEVGRVKGHFGPINTCVWSTHSLSIHAEPCIELPSTPKVLHTRQEERMDSCGCIISTTRTSKPSLTAILRSWIEQRILCTLDTVSKNIFLTMRAKPTFKLDSPRGGRQEGLM